MIVSNCVAAAKRGRLRYLLAGSILAGLAAAPAYAEGTQAGTQIVNTAKATYGDPENPTTVDSNEVSLLVDELLDVTITWDDTADVPGEPGETNLMLTFTLTNAGNGVEAFRLSALGGPDDAFDPEFTSIVLDTNGNGTYDPGTDQVYASGTNDPELQPDDSIQIFVFSTIPGDATDTERGRMDLKALAVTGVNLLTRTAGTVVDDAGDGGGDAVFGETEADAEKDGWYVVDEEAPPPNNVDVDLQKSATVTDVYGGERKIPGSTITYELKAVVTGTGSASGLRVTDTVPEGTTYKPDSLKLNGGVLTDADDATDDGQFIDTDCDTLPRTASACGISVDLGTVAVGDDPTVSFEVVIDEGDEN